MEVWKGKVALVTGASVGIGASIAQDLVKSGMTVVGAARRVQLIEDLAEGLQGEEGRLIARQLDLTKEVDIVELFQYIDSELGGADVIINNGATVADTPISEAESEEIRKCFETNVIGLTLCCREALKSMVRRDMKDGHIININRLITFTGLQHGTYSHNNDAVGSELLEKEKNNKS